MRSFFHRRRSLTKCMAKIEENPMTSERQIAQNNNAIHAMITKLFKDSKLHPYKIHPRQELCGDDLDCTIEFCEDMMKMLDQHE